MDFLNKTAAQIADLFKSMTLGARITAGLLLAGIVVSLLYLFNHQMAGGDTWLLGGHSFSANELPTVQAALAKAGLGYELVGSQIRIPGSQQTAYVAALAEDNALPANWGDLLVKAVESSSPFTTTKDREDRLRIYKLQNLSLILRDLPDVVNAHVDYDVKKRGGLRQEQEATAVASVKLAGGRTLDKQRVDLIRSIVVGAFSGLNPSKVTVADLNGRVWAGPDEMGTGDNHRYLEVMKAHEQNYEEKIRTALSYVPDVSVSVHVELSPELHSSIEELKHNKNVVPVTISEESTTEKSDTPQRRGAPGFDSQQPNQPASITQTAASATSEKEITRRDEQNAVDRNVTRTQNIGLLPKRVTVAVGIPSSYYAKIWHERNPAPQGQAPQAPDRTALAQIEQEETASIRKHVELLIPKPATELDKTPLVSIETFEHIRPPDLEGPPASEKALTWFAQNWSFLGLVGLGLFSLVMLRSVVRSAPVDVAPSEALRVAAADLDEQPEDEQETASETPRTRLKRRVSTGASLRDELAQLVREDPDAAANILRGWIGNAS
jgi:flagellar M-ring protein FliF